MFSKLFSSKSDTAKGSKELSADIHQAISSLLLAYRSAVFPAGFSSVVTINHIVQVHENIEIELTVPFPCSYELSLIGDHLTEKLNKTVVISARCDVQAVRSHEIKGVKNIIAVSSGKGGVGKSTTAVNLAYALQAEGASVGVLDADIYGPSIPTLLGMKNEKPTSDDGKSMTPIEKDGVVAMSIGFLVDETDATVWRGPMASRAFGQLLNETAWPELDYLIVDMPPGTGDIQLTLAQSVPVAAAVVITTPQDIALIDAVKGIAMFEKVQVPVLGIIENMSYHICENCGHESHLFGHGGGENIAKDFDAKLLGQLPLDIHIRQNADQGINTIVEDSSGELALRYRKIAQNVAAELFFQLDMRSNATANIVLEDSE